MYQVKDFIQTNEGLLFAVVHSALESGRVLVFLRYVLETKVQILTTTDHYKFTSSLINYRVLNILVQN